VEIDACNPTYSTGGSRRILSSRPVQAKLLRLYCKKNFFKYKQKVWGHDTCVACMTPWVQSPVQHQPKSLFCSAYGVLEEVWFQRISDNLRQKKFSGDEHEVLKRA
jgi:hypothetical protein